MTAGVLLDSTVLIDALRGGPVVDRLRRVRRSGQELLTTAINVEEIVRGLRDTEEPVAEALFGGLLVVPVTRADAERAGTWRRGFAERGVTLHQADCLIAACAVAAGARLATANVRDFPMPELDVEHWPAG